MMNNVLLFHLAVLAIQLLLWVWGLAAQVVAPPTSRQAQVITYNITPSAKTPDAIYPLPYTTYQHIYSDPYRLLLFGTLQDHGGYLLHHMKWDMTFYCLADSTGIAFIPSSTSDRSLAASHPIPTHCHDTIIGLPALEYIAILGPDTSRYWTTTQIPTSFHPSDQIPGVLLAFEQLLPAATFDHRAIAIDTITLNEKFVDPSLHLSPVTFDTHIESFGAIVNNGSRPLMKMINGKVRGSIVNPCPDFEVIQIPDYKPYIAGNPIPHYPLKFFGSARNELGVLQEHSYVLLIVDYTTLNPVPRFLTDWIQHQLLMDPTFPIVIGTRKVPGLQALIKENPILQALPHAVLSAEEFVPYGWMDPLSYVVINSDGNIESITSAYDVHSIEELNQLMKLD